jgi:hypothetical protein
MPKLTNWRPEFSLTYDPALRRDMLVKIWRFMQKSQHGDSIDFDEGVRFQLVGNVHGREGKDYKEGDQVITSAVKSLVHAHHKDDGNALAFAFFTENTIYDVSLDSIDTDIANECRSLVHIRG